MWVVSVMTLPTFAALPTFSTCCFRGIVESKSNAGGVMSKDEQEEHNSALKSATITCYFSVMRVLI